MQKDCQLLHDVCMWVRAVGKRWRASLSIFVCDAASTSAMRATGMFATHTPAWPLCLALQVESKAQVLKRRRETQYEFLYTVPVMPKAGETVELFFNPDLTPLRGRPEIYVRGSFNRWVGLCTASCTTVTVDGMHQLPTTFVTS